MQYVLRSSTGRISGDAEGVENRQPVDETENRQPVDGINTDE